MIAPDDTTYQYMAGRPLAPQGAAWDAALKRWRTLPSDAGAKFDKEVDIDVAKLRPMVTFGTNPGMVMPIDEAVPTDGDPAFRKALAYMQVEAGKPMLGQAGRRRVHRLVHERPLERHSRRPRASCAGAASPSACACSSCPAPQDVKRQAEAEGLDEVVRAAGGEWREPGCSMCIGMNGDTVPSGKLSVSTSNRNFEGRQGTRRAHRAREPADGRGRRRQRRDHRSARARELTMEPIKEIRSRTVVLPNDDIDTDQIIPARFLTTTTKQGLGKNLFNDWRYGKDGSERPDFVLNKPENRGAQRARRRQQLRLRLVARARAVGAARLRHSRRREHRDRRHLSQQLAEERLACPSSSMPRRIAGCSTIRAPRCASISTTTTLEVDGKRVPFPIDRFSRYCLMNGVDQLGFLLERSAAIARYEQAHA